MAIFDIFNNEILHFENFPNDEVHTIEFGAGKGCFGKKFLPTCYLTDIYQIDLPHFKTLDEYDENSNCHYLDHICDFLDSPSIERTFNKLVFCNPYEFGVGGYGETKQFLSRAGELLDIGGEILIVGNSTNRWSQYKKAKKYYDQLIQDENLDYRFEIADLITLNDNHPYRVNNVYTLSNINVQTFPNQLYTITKLG